MEFFTRYNRPRPRGLECVLPSKTEQAHKDQYDLNRLLRQYTRTGVLATADQVRNVFYGDFSEIGDNFDAQIKIKNAERHFMELPSEVRAHFKNSPENFLKAFQDDSEGNISKLVELGLLRDSALPVKHNDDKKEE